MLPVPAFWVKIGQEEARAKQDTSAGESGRATKRLGYRTPEELFDASLDSVYAV